MPVFWIFLALLIGAPVASVAGDFPMGHAIWLDLDGAEALVELHGERSYFETRDTGNPASRLEWTFLDCAGQLLGQTYPWDPRWVDGFHSPAPNGELGPRSPGYLQEGSLSAGAVVPPGTARFTVRERRSEDDMDGVLRGPFRVPDGIWPCEEGEG